MQGRWTGVCSSSWNYQDAFVVCRQLGYPATGMKIRTILAINIIICSSSWHTVRMKLHSGDIRLFGNNQIALCYNKIFVFEFTLL